MKKLVGVIASFLISNYVWADVFGTGANQFSIDFVSISGDASSANGTYLGLSNSYGFNDPGYNYRMQKYEVSNDQWNKFVSLLGTRVTGSNTYNCYGHDPVWTGSNIPVNNISWYEAAQFINWLNTSTGHQAAYKFVGTQGTSNYTFTLWQLGDTGYNANNPYRNSNAYYFLPTENEWVKTAYWNGTTLQQYATKAGQAVYQGDGTNGGWNFDGTLHMPWAVGSSSEELNGTYDMMGNLWEWTETGQSNYVRNVRGGTYYRGISDIILSCDNSDTFDGGYFGSALGFRVASVPEPVTLLLLGLGAAMLRNKNGKGY